MVEPTTQVRPYTDSDAPVWDKYVLASPSATLFHLTAWNRAVAESYGHQPVHRVAWSGARPVGVLPLFLVKSALVGKILVSVPYATYGGILADTNEAAEELLASAKHLCRELRTEYLELRHRDRNSLDLPEIGRYDTFRKQLPDRAEDILPAFPRKARAAARKGLETLSVEIRPGLLDTVYDLYAITMRRLGSPNYRRSFFRALQRLYQDNSVCLVVKDQNRPVAGVISYVFRDEIVPYFSGSLEEGMRKNASNVMYLRLMEYAVHRGLKWFDFNRTRRDNRGPHAFKRHHGFEPSPLHYQVYLNRSGKLPNLSPSSRKYALASRLWRKLPLWLTRSAGGYVTRWIP